jgi:hypothetical protein
MVVVNVPLDGDGETRTRVRGRVSNGVYRLSRRLDLVSQGLAGGRICETSLLKSPRSVEASLPGEPVVDAGIPPHGPREGRRSLLSF